MNGLWPLRRPLTVSSSLSLEQQERLHRLLLVVGDAVALATALAVAYWLRFHSSVTIFDVTGAGRPDWYARLAIMVAALWLGLFWLIGLYDERNLLGGTRECALAFQALAAGAMAIMVFTFLSPGFIVARGWLLLAWGLAFLLVLVERFRLRRLVYRLRDRGWFLRPAVIVGAGAEAAALAEQLTAHRLSGLEVRGLVVPATGATGQDLASVIPLIGTLEQLEDLVSADGIRDIVVATGEVERPDLVDLFRRFSRRPDVRLRLSGGLFEVITTGLDVKEVAYVPLVQVRPVRLSGIDRLLKALLDYGIAIPAVVVGAPFFLLLALLVKLDSPGPVFHRRKVLGLGGRTFDALKFRTMYIDGDAILARQPELRRELEQNHKLQDDPRVTRLGRILRRLSLDELPQFINVLVGQMSVVGPRMITPAEHAEYGDWDLNLLTVKPGITGLWQVSGRSDVPYPERVRLDMFYIRNWTIWLDLQILWQTIPAVLRGHGAR